MQPEHRGFLSPLLPGLFVVAVIAGQLLGQEQPSAQPASQPATRPGMARGAGRGPVSTNPRDQLPFSNTSLTNVKPVLPTLFICGDSTAANGNPRQRGWGSLLIDYFDTSKVNLVNDKGKAIEAYKPGGNP